MEKRERQRKKREEIFYLIDLYKYIASISTKFALLLYLLCFGLFVITHTQTNEEGEREGKKKNKKEGRTNIICVYYY